MRGRTESGFVVDEEERIARTKEKIDPLIVAVFFGVPVINTSLSRLISGQFPVIFTFPLSDVSFIVRGGAVLFRVFFSQCLTSAGLSTAKR